MGRPGYPNMTGITYSAGGAQDYILMERLFITSSPDSITYIFPFDCKKMGDYREMNVPANVHVRGGDHPQRKQYFLRGHDQY